MDSLRGVPNLTLAEKYTIACIDLMKQRWPYFVVGEEFMLKLETAYHMHHERTDKLDAFFDKYGVKIEEKNV